VATQPRIGRTLGAGDHVPTPTGMAIGTPRAEIVVPIDGKPRFRELSIVSCSLTFFYANGRWECQFAAVTGYDGYKGPNHYELSLNGSDWPDYMRDAVRQWHESVLAVTEATTVRG